MRRRARRARDAPLQGAGTEKSQEGPRQGASIRIAPPAQAARRRCSIEQTSGRGRPDPSGDVQSRGRRVPAPHPTSRGLTAQSRDARGAVRDVSRRRGRGPGWRGAPPAVRAAAS